MKKVQKIKKTIISMFLMLALVTVQVMQVAAETDATPSVVCSSYSELFQAIIQAQDGDVIGIDGTIIMNGSQQIAFGSQDKHVTIKRMNENAHVEINTLYQAIIQNITFDGNGIQGNHPMCIVYNHAEFNDVTFKNCQTLADGGAVQVYVGNVTMNRCIFQGNTGKNGGHVAVFNGSVLNMTGCSLKDGHATGNGGAIYYESTSSQYGQAASSLIHGNSADVSGGGIHIASGSLCVDASSKFYGNTAPQGEDMTVLVTGNGNYTDSVDVLNQLFADDNINVKGWNMTTDPGTASNYYKLDYETITQPSEPVDPAPGDSGNENPSEPSDSTGEGGTGEGGNNNQSGDASGTGTDSGAGGNTSNDNSDNSTTDNSSHDTTNNDNSSHDTTTTTTDNSSSDTITTDNSSHDTITTDNSDHSSMNTTTTTDNSQTSTDNSQTTSNSGNTTTTTDNRRTETSDNHSSTIYNYYQTQKEPVEQMQVMSEQGQTPVIVNNYIQQSKEPGKEEQGQQVTESAQQTVIVPDPSNNIKIDAKDVDVVFEVKDGVYSITINSSEPVQEDVAPVPEPASSVDWYEVIKIVLLGALVVNMMWQPRKKTFQDNAE